MYGTTPIEVVIEILLLVMSVLCFLCISCSFCHTFCCLFSCSSLLYSVVSPTPCLLFVDTNLFSSYTLIHACVLQFLHHHIIYLLGLCQQWNHEMYMHENSSGQTCLLHFGHTSSCFYMHIISLLLCSPPTVCLISSPSGAWKVC